MVTVVLRYLIKSLYCSVLELDVVRVARLSKKVPIGLLFAAVDTVKFGFGALPLLGYFLKHW